MKGKNGIVDFSRARVSRKKVSPGRYGGNIAIFLFGLIKKACTFLIAPVE